MTSIAVLAARRVRGALKALFPSVPPADQARILAAMEGRDYQSPAPTSGGEAGTGAGREPGSRPSSGDQHPGSHTPHAEVLLNWRAHPAHRWEFTDTRLADLVDRWSREVTS